MKLEQVHAQGAKFQVFFLNQAMPAKVTLELNYMISAP